MSRRGWAMWWTVLTVVCVFALVLAYGLVRAAGREAPEPYVAREGTPTTNPYDHIAFTPNGGVTFDSTLQVDRFYVTPDGLVRDEQDPKLVTTGKRLKIDTVTEIVVTANGKEWVKLHTTAPDSMRVVVEGAGIVSLGDLRALARGFKR